MRAVGQAHRGGSARDFLHGDAVLEVAKARSAPLLLNGKTEQTELAHLRPKFAREDIAAINLGGARCDAILGETADGLAQLVDIFAQSEIESSPSVGDRHMPPIFGCLYSDFISGTGGSVRSLRSNP